MFFKKNINYILFYLISFTIIIIESNVIGDFDIFLNASKDLFFNKNIYTEKYHGSFHYFYDVFFAIIIHPLTYLPLYFANFIWLTINVFLSLRIWKIISYYLPPDFLSDKDFKLYRLLCLVVIFSLWHKNMHLTQMTIFMLYLSLEGLNSIFNKKIYLGSFLLSFGITIKLFPLVFIPYLIYRKQFFSSLLIILFTIIILLIPAIFIGFDFNFFLLKERWLILNPVNTEHILDVSERSFHSLSSLLSILLVENAGNNYSLKIKRNILNVELETLKYILNITRLFFILLSIYFFKSLPFKVEKNKYQLFYEISYILLIIPLIFPHQQHYAFFLAFPSICYLIYFYVIKFKSKKFKENNQLTFLLYVFLFVLIYFLLNSFFILGEFRKYYDHFKTLTYGILFIIPLLACNTPKKLNAFKKEYLNSENN